MPAGLEWTEDGLDATIDALKGTKEPEGQAGVHPVRMRRSITPGRRPTRS